MEKKTILIANTHKEQVEFLKKALEQNKIDIDVLNVETTNSENMKEAIIKYKPDIVLTNEMKKDKPATDIIREIQDDITSHQPIFIISSGYPTFDIERTCSQKGVHAYSFFILDGEDKLALEIGKIARGEKTELNKHEYYNFSKVNVDTTGNFMENKATQYIYNEYYKHINNELSELHKEFEKAPRRIREKIKKFEELQAQNNMFECSFIYQYFKSKMNK